MPAALKFVIYFLVTYLLIQLAYTAYLWSFEPAADPITRWTAQVLTLFFDQAALYEIPLSGKIQFIIQGRPMVNILEGCNGVSVLITLVSFLFAFPSNRNRLIVFSVLSIIILFIGNIVRLFALVQIKMKHPEMFVFFHEYLFPVLLYLLAFVIMVFWVKDKPKEESI